MRPRLPSSREQGVGQHCTGQGQPPALCPWAVCRLPGTRFPAFTPPLLAPRQQQAPQPRRPGWPSVHMKSSGLPGQAAPDTQPQPSRGALGRGPEGTQLARTPALGTHRGPTKALLSTCSVRTSPGGQWRLGGARVQQPHWHSALGPGTSMLCHECSGWGVSDVKPQTRDRPAQARQSWRLRLGGGQWPIPGCWTHGAPPWTDTGLSSHSLPLSALPRMSSAWREPTWQLWKLL